MAWIKEMFWWVVHCPLTISLGFDLFSSHRLELRSHCRTQASTKQINKKKGSFLHSCAITQFSQIVRKIKTACRRFVHTKCHCCQNHAGVCVWKSVPQTYFHLKAQWLILTQKTSNLSQTRTVAVWNCNILKSSHNWKFRKTHTHWHANTSKNSAELCGDCITWPQAQLHYGMPVYFLQLIDHMKPLELDKESLGQRVI